MTNILNPLFSHCVGFVPVQPEERKEKYYLYEIYDSVKNYLQEKTTEELAEKYMKYRECIVEGKLGNSKLKENEKNVVLMMEDIIKEIILERKIQFKETMNNDNRN